MQLLSQGLGRLVLGDLEDREPMLDPLIKYLLKNWATHTGYFRDYFICHLLHTAIVMCHLHFMNYISSGLIVSHGLSLLETLFQNPSQRADPLVQLFPPIVKCTFRFHGPSGTVQSEDALCLLNMNPCFERLFLLLFCWFLIVSVVSILHILYLLLVMTVPSLRFVECTNHSSGQNDQLVRFHLSTLKFEKKHNVNDWFILKMLSKNLDERLFRLFLSDLQREMGGKCSSGDETAIDQVDKHDKAVVADSQGEKPTINEEKKNMNTVDFKILNECHPNKVKKRLVHNNEIKLEDI